MKMYRIKVDSKTFIKVERKVNSDKFAQRTYPIAFTDVNGNHYALQHGGLGVFAGDYTAEDIYNYCRCHDDINYDEQVTIISCFSGTIKINNGNTRHLANTLFPFFISFDYNEETVIIEELENRDDVNNKAREYSLETGESEISLRKSFRRAFKEGFADWSTYLKWLRII